MVDQPESHQTPVLGDHLEGKLRSVGMERFENISFHIDDIPYHVNHKRDPKSGRSLIYIQAVLGFLPFSIESAEKRQSLLAILSAARALPHVRFGVDFQNRIFAAANFSAATVVAPDFMFYPLMLFLQQSRPFMDLIGTYLSDGKAQSLGGVNGAVVQGAAQD